MTTVSLKSSIVPSLSLFFLILLSPSDDGSSVSEHGSLSEQYMSDALYRNSYIIITIMFLARHDTF